MGLWSGLIAKPQGTPLKSRPSLTLYFLLTGAFLLTLVPHVVQFPAWVTGLIVVALVLRSIIEVYRLPLPSTTFCGILALILFLLAWIQFGTFLGRSFGTAVTAGLLAIKFYEIRGPRDIALIIFSCFFVVMSALLFSQMLELFVYCLIMMWVLTALLLRVHAGDMPDDMLLRMLVKAGVIFLQALPLGVLLFFFFPRINGPLGIPLSDPPIGVTDRVAPGAISRLALDDSPAMYVSFDANGAVPLPEAMYWRALVLYQYDHGVFTAGPELARESDEAATGESLPRPPPGEGLHFAQTITILTNNQKWLYALDVPISEPENPAESGSWATIVNGDTLRLVNTSAKLDHLSKYTVNSSPFRTEETMTPAEWHASLELPTATTEGPISPEVKAFSDQLFQQAGGDKNAYLAAVLHYFHYGGFTYSINFPAQGKDWLTEFLLKRKVGYCEHFASAFAVLMRLQGIPTRLVVGYVGGDFNPYNGRYAVRQSSAHAWDEIWKPTAPMATNPKSELTGRWTRIDPTAFVGNIATSAPLGNNPSAAGRPILFVQRDPSLADAYLPDWLKGSLREARLRREQLETTWDDVVLSYDTDTQLRLAQALGFGLNPLFKLFLVCVGAAAICAIVLWRWLSRKPQVPPVEFLYAAFCRTMARRGIPRATWEGPLAYTERVAEAFPDDLPTLRNVGAIVSRARYGPRPADAQAIDRLQTALSLISASQAASVSREKSREPFQREDMKQ